LIPTPISVMPKRSSGITPVISRQRAAIVTGSAALPLVASEVASRSPTTAHVVRRSRRRRDEEAMVHRGHAMKTVAFAISSQIAVASNERMRAAAPAPMAVRSAIARPCM